METSTVVEVVEIGFAALLFAVAGYIGEHGARKTFFWRVEPMVDFQHDFETHQAGWKAYCRFGVEA